VENLVIYRTRVPEYLQAIYRSQGLISQPDSRSCQATCIALATGWDTPIGLIYDDLDQLGIPGDPGVMAKYLGDRFGDRYRYHSNASLRNAIESLKNGSLLITHGWFTGFGHVIAIDGYDEEKGFHVVDPWEEFHGPHWTYPKEEEGFRGIYSTRMIYAACVSGESCDHARSEYQKGAVDFNFGNTWIHEIKM
jgi:hypothetical protein